MNIRLSKECANALSLLGIDDAKGVNGFIMGCLTTANSEKEVIGMPALPPQEKESIAESNSKIVPKYISVNGKYTPEYYRCQKVFEGNTIVDGEIYAGQEIGMIPAEEYYIASGITERLEIFHSKFIVNNGFTFIGAHD